MDYLKWKNEVEPEAIAAMSDREIDRSISDCQEMIWKAEDAMADFPLDSSNYKARVRHKDTAEKNLKMLHRVRHDRQQQRAREQYDQRVQEKSRASTEDEFSRLAGQFREMGSYKDAVRFADECDAQYNKLKEKREEEQKKIAAATKSRANSILIVQLGIFAIFLYIIFGTDTLYSLWRG